MTADDYRRFVDELNREYAALHTAKEDAFWVSYMGLGEDADAARAELDRREIALQRFMQDPERLAQVRNAIAAAGAKGATIGDEDLVAMRGWEATFAANVIDSAEARALGEEIINDEGALARKRGAMELGYEHPDDGFVKASSVKLGTMLVSESDERLRRAAWDGLRSIEPFVLDHGFVQIVKKRNQLGRMLGGEDYYDWKVKRTEGMPKRAIFELLDELEEKTRDAGRRAIEELRAAHGAAQVTPWNIKYLTAGDVTREQDPYFPFESALERWGRSFAALGIDFDRATMKLDLVDRDGKYENGFMHGPEVAWREHGKRHHARIHFTANAIPGMIGSGRRAMATLFHEGGHAAHFANIDMPAPCFGQEFAPTSVAFAEIQSMFLDSLLDDADWQARYARTTSGEAMPWELIEKGIRATQPYAAWGARAMLAVCYGERALYEMSEDDLTPERVLEKLREVERELLFLDAGSPRPILSVPHLLSGESSAYYHGYVMAQMGVYQTRRFFLERDGYLLDNPKIGPDLRTHYWRPGNSRRCSDLVKGLTGESLCAAAYAEEVNRTADEMVELAKQSLERASTIPSFEDAITLNATIEVVHGDDTVTRIKGNDFNNGSREFAGWIDSLKVATPA
ncbi:MAG: M3 family metallopeptidase [Phycisphaerales bacterium]